MLAYYQLRHQTRQSDGLKESKCLKYFESWISFLLAVPGEPYQCTWRYLWTWVSDHVHISRIAGTANFNAAMCLAHKLQALPFLVPPAKNVLFLSLRQCLFMYDYRISKSVDRHRLTQQNFLHINTRLHNPVNIELNKHNAAQFQQ